MMSLAMAPPFKLIDPNLEATRIYMVLARLLSEDLPQLLLQAHFTITVYQNWFVMVKMGVSLLFALMDAKDVYNYCTSQDQQHPYDTYVNVEMAAAEGRKEAGLLKVEAGATENSLACCGLSASRPTWQMH